MFSRPGPHTPWSTARERVADGHAVVFWRPGCGFCARLLHGLGDDARVTWVNIWDDDEAAAVVRQHNNGDELVPTAVVGGTVLRNPSAHEVVAALA